MNSAVGPIFNEKSCWKMKFVGLWTVHGCTVHREKVNICGYCSMNSAWTVAASLPETRENKIKKKRKKRNLNSQTQTQLQPNPNGHYINFYFIIFLQSFFLISHYFDWIIIMDMYVQFIIVVFYDEHISN